MSIEKSLFDLVESRLNPRFRVTANYNSVTDWTVEITTQMEQKQVLFCQSCDREKAFAEAYLKFTGYLSEELGGY